MAENPVSLNDWGKKSDVVPHKVPRFQKYFQWMKHLLQKPQALLIFADAETIAFAAPWCMVIRQNSWSLFVIHMVRYGFGHPLHVFICLFFGAVNIALWIRSYQARLSDASLPVSELAYAWLYAFSFMHVPGTTLRWATPSHVDLKLILWGEGDAERGGNSKFIR